MAWPEIRTAVESVGYIGRSMAWPPTERWALKPRKNAQLKKVASRASETRIACNSRCYEGNTATPSGGPARSTGLAVKFRPVTSPVARQKRSPQQSFQQLSVSGESSLLICLCFSLRRLGAFRFGKSFRRFNSTCAGM